MMMTGPAATRRELLLAASREIAERGYSATSFAAVAARIGLTKGAFSYHFPTKRDLARALAGAFHDALVYADADARRFFPEGDLRTAIRCLMSLSLQTSRSPFARAALTLVFDPEPPVEEVGEEFEFWTAMLAEYLRVAEEKHQARLVMPGDECATYLTVTLLGMSFLSQRDFVQPRVDQLTALRCMLDSIGVVDARAVTDEALAEPVIYEWPQSDLNRAEILG
ncbi:TetR/AcrR family transcriptional regulator [Pseudactinotalea sp. HY158]|uniref:TetR/AcrR family transcriptional regulator n=1 Tax=Pseudactinotalea sp. HY158 TaxID=2654547 RepID=UPI001E4CFAF8|nr:TetR/AcrR family transcriptional regulator [Pseudactinotalea sp. HY158]